MKTSSRSLFRHACALFTTILFGLPMVAAAAPCEPLPAGAVSWWRAEGNAQDSVDGNHGTLEGVGFAPGKVGQAFDVVPSNHRVSIPDSPALQLTNSFTIEGWFNTRDGLGKILERGDTRPGADAYTIDLYGPGGTLSFRISDGSNDPGHGAEVYTPVQLNQWIHFAGTLDDASGIMRLYTNGQLAAQITTSVRSQGPLAPGFGGGLGIGNTIGYDFNFNGLLDEITFYKRALSAAEVLAIYHAGDSGKCLPDNPPVSSSFLLNLDFGSGPGPSPKAGLAVVGKTAADFWNYFTRDIPGGGYRTFGALTHLELADGTTTDIGMTTANAPGAWSNGSTDPMYNWYIYPFDGGNVTVTVTNLPAGHYDVLAYSGDGNYEVTAGGVSYGIKHTRDYPLANPPVWTEGLQYSRFTNVQVSAGQPLVLTVRPGIDGYALISGIQILQTFSDSEPACIAPRPGLIAWWRAEGDGVDSVGGHNGTLEGISFVPGEVGQAFNVGPVGGRLSVPDSTDFYLTNSLTIEGWYLTRQRAGVIFNRGDSRGGFDPYGIDFNGVNGDLSFRIHDDLNNVGEVHLPMPTNVWTHFACTLEGTTGSMRLYTNGVLAGETITTVRPLAALDPSLPGGVGIGNTIFHAFNLDGLIDEISLYSRALTPAEIQDIYHAGSAGKCTSSPDCVPISGPVAWWRAEGNAQDSADGNHGSLEGVGFAPGKVGQAFDVVPSNHRVSIPDSPALQLTNSFTIEGWFNTRDGLGKILERGDTRPGADAYTIDLYGPGGTLSFRISDGSNDPGHGAEVYTPVQLNQWIHFAGTLDDASGIMRLYTNGQLAAQITTSVRSQGPLAPGFGGGLGIGNTIGYDFNFNGLLDEITFYKRALSAAEVLAIYNAGSAGKCYPLPPSPAPPAILQPPTNQLATVGGVARFSVVATNEPLSYQWFSNSVPIPGSTDAFLALSNVQANFATDYFVRVSNPAGVSNSAVATLTINRPPFATNMNAAVRQLQVLHIDREKILLFTSDPDGDLVTVSNVQSFSVNGGTVVLGPADVAYTPPGGFVGTDRFLYRVSDGRGGLAIATIFVDVTFRGNPSQNILPPVPLSGGQTGFRVTFAGIPGRTYTLQRGQSPTGPFITLTTVTVGANGIGSYDDVDAPPDAAFYRTLYP